MRALSQSEGMPRTLSQSIYVYIKDAIINNRLKANQKIDEKEIAKRFSVSTTPVREAVLRLGAKGFVTLDSHKEAVVKEVSFRELKEILQVLGTLDSVASPLAVDCLAPDKMKEIERLTAELERSCKKRVIKDYLSRNIGIHKKIWACVANRFLQETLFTINEQMLRYSSALFHAFKKPGVLERSLGEHREILDALKEKDGAKLSSLLGEHWRALLQPSPFEEGLKEYFKNV